ncbi:transposase [Massilia agilis]|uniref:Transposase n=1 Tax=Massilia agilis TaxID=1811226 RepID=A0ABT2DIP3_9BURK|nr:transposase [Massilia agilis]MCS0810333.1 transposase [Massilia agilis]
MARQSRLILPNQPHHVIHRGNDNQLIFREPEDYERLVGWLKESARFYNVAVHAYVLMPNHFHLLATPSDGTGLALMMQKIGRLYVPWFNQKYNRSGSLFQGRFRTSLVEADKYFLACCRYIELNPVRAQLAADPAEYPWSSYRHHAGLRPDPVVSDHSLYWSLGNTPFQREAAYIELVQQGLPEQELRQIDEAVRKGWPLATDTFKAELERKTSRRILPAKRGRPFKQAPPAA